MLKHYALSIFCMNPHFCPMGLQMNNHLAEILTNFLCSHICHILAFVPSFKIRHFNYNENPKLFPCFIATNVCKERKVTDGQMVRAGISVTAMCGHNLKVMSSDPGRVKLGMHSTSVLSLT